jgi:hypothetical protein
MPGCSELFSKEYFEGLFGNSACCSWLIPPIEPPPEEVPLTVPPEAGGGLLSFFENIPLELKALIGIAVASLVTYSVFRLVKGKKPASGGE